MRSKKTITKGTSGRFLQASRRPIGSFLCIVLLSSLATPVIHSQARPTDYDVKSAYLFNFGKFVHYPETDSKPRDFDICLLGNSPIGPILEKTALNESVDDRPVRIKQLDKAADARDCAVVFMGDSESGRIDKDLAALEGSNALTVSDVPQFLEHGGMIQFLLQNDRVRFAVNLQAVDRTRLQLSSELLKVAVYVNSSPAGEVK